MRESAVMVEGFLACEDEAKANSFSDLLYQRISSPEGAFLFWHSAEGLSRCWAKIHLAWYKGKPVGGLFTVVDGISVGHLGGVNVLPEFRGRGICSQLLEHALDDLETRGIRRVDLTVRASQRPNGASYRSYGAAGFEDGIVKKVLISGTETDKHLLEFIDGYDERGWPYFETLVMHCALPRRKATGSLKLRTK